MVKFFKEESEDEIIEELERWIEDRYGRLIRINLCAKIAQVPRGGSHPKFTENLHKTHIKSTLKLAPQTW